MEENKILQDELDNLRRNSNSYSGHFSVTKSTTATTPTQVTEFSFQSPRHPSNRMQGDGADNVPDEFDTPSGSRYSSGSSSLLDGRRKLSGTTRPLILPLDQLLNSSTMDIPVTSNISSLDSPSISRNHSVDLGGSDVPPSAASQIAGLRVALSNQQRRVEHLSELLNESEANVARLEEQAKVLKEEIRRLERITLRESQFALSNPPNTPGLESSDSDSDATKRDAQLRTEYLKNVILKLVCSPPDSAERPQLTSNINLNKLQTGFRSDRHISNQL
ncbi:unnamed protein product [Echinostoma caproni]|uniref:Rab_bind domain-containing protein n=1 Tax=Echinostoma caproni TaxID=27848 RepID=A0A183B8M0_9TREM|nr:unnamed protein product [Echinostoma caproni]